MQARNNSERRKYEYENCQRAGRIDAEPDNAADNLTQCLDCRFFLASKEYEIE